MHVIKAWKKVGETPLQALERTRADHKVEAELKSCYTGRLDPMAQGLMTFLFGEMIHCSETYNQSRKTYRFQAILGISTNSYDPMGRITSFRQISSAEARAYQAEMLKLLGTQEQPLPPYSAYRYKGKPLWKHALEGTLPDPLPTKSVEILSICNLNPHPVKIDLDQYRSECLDDIKDVQELNPDTFRYQEIISDWNDQSHLDYIWRISFEADVTAGTYIRALVHDLGAQMGIPAHAFRITRTSFLETSFLETSGIAHDTNVYLISN